MRQELEFSGRTACKKLADPAYSDFDRVTEFPDWDGRSKTIKVGRATGSCLDSIGVEHGDVFLFDTALSITSGDAVIIERQPMAPGETVDIFSKVLLWLAGSWWYASDQGLHAMSPMHDRILGRVVLAMHRRRDLPMEDVALYESLKQTRKQFQEMMRYAGAALYTLGLHGQDRTTVFRAAKLAA